MQSIRKFTTVTLFLSAFFLFISAIVLFFAPGSKEAAAMGWNIIGIDKPAFKLMHKIFGVTMGLCAINHVIMNRKALWNHIKNVSGCPISAQARISFIVIIILFVATIVFSRGA